MTNPDGRQIVPAGEQDMVSDHMYPIAKFLIEERGHFPFERPDRYGFRVGWESKLTRVITSEDWDAINEHFVIPDNIGFFQGIIRDNANHIDILGFDEIIGLNGVETIDRLESEIRERDAHLQHPPEASPDQP